VPPYDGEYKAELAGEGRQLSELAGAPPLAELPGDGGIELVPQELQASSVVK